MATSDLSSEVTSATFCSWKQSQEEHRPHFLTRGASRKVDASFQSSGITQCLARHKHPGSYNHIRALVLFALKQLYQLTLGIKGLIQEAPREAPREALREVSGS